MKFALITGVSKGLGESVATFLLESKINVIGISRTENKDLLQIAKKNNVEYKHYLCDLSDRENVETMLVNVFQMLDTYKLSQIYVINNAATLDPINPTVNINNEQLEYHFTVNAITPMIILNTFLKHYKDREKLIIGANVTSGAANSPIYGWSAYCSSKASIDAYTKTAALEAEHLQTGHKIIGFNPGVMNTNMQEKIRKTNEHSFRDVETFRQLKENNVLQETDIVGGVLVDILTADVNIQNGKIYNVNDYV